VSANRRLQTDKSVSTSVPRFRLLPRELTSPPFLLLALPGRREALRHPHSRDERSITRRAKRGGASAGRADHGSDPRQPGLNPPEPRAAGSSWQSLTSAATDAYSWLRFERAPLVRGWRPGKTQLTARAGKQRTICSWRNPRADFFVPKKRSPLRFASHGCSKPRTRDEEGLTD
jgi:hypothetical protein